MIIVVQLDKVAIATLSGDLKSYVAGIDDSAAVLKVVPLVNLCGHGLLVEDVDVWELLLVFFQRGVFIVYHHYNVPGIATLSQCIVCVDLVRPAVREDQCNKAVIHLVRPPP